MGLLSIGRTKRNSYRFHELKLIVFLVSLTMFQGHNYHLKE